LPLNELGLGPLPLELEVPAPDEAADELPVEVTVTPNGVELVLAPEVTETVEEPEPDEADEPDEVEDMLDEVEDAVGAMEKSPVWANTWLMLVMLTASRM